MKNTRAPEDLRNIELCFAYERASGVIESSCIPALIEEDFTEWWDLESSEEDLADEVDYLTSRNLIEFHADHPRWARICDEDEPTSRTEDYPSRLMKKLKSIAPPDMFERKPADITNLTQMNFRLEPIRRAAETFAVFLEGETSVPLNDQIALLWVFGELLQRDLERMLNIQQKLLVDMQNVMLTPPTFKKSEIEEKNNG